MSNIIQNIVFLRRGAGSSRNAALPNTAPQRVLRTIQLRLRGYGKGNQSDLSPEGFENIFKRFG